MQIVWVDLSLPDIVCLSEKEVRQAEARGSIELVSA
jgi:hypothetical protein